MDTQNVLYCSLLSNAVHILMLWRLQKGPEITNTQTAQSWGVKHWHLLIPTCLAEFEKRKKTTLCSTHTHTHTHQSKDWFQEILLSVLSDAANHNPPLSSLRPLSLSFPPMFLLPFTFLWTVLSDKDWRMSERDGAYLGLRIALHPAYPFLLLFFLFFSHEITDPQA